MKNPLFKSTLAFALLSLAGIAHGQYTYTVGTAPGGGNTIVGNGALGELLTSPPLSATGGDSITINLGAVAISTTTSSTVLITTQNNTLVNNGGMLGHDGFNPGDGGFIVISGDGGPQVIINNGMMAGGAGAADTSYHNSGGDGGNAIDFNYPALGGISITNTDILAGGNGGDGGGGGGSGGTGARAINLVGTSTLNAITINNSGFLLGGNGGMDTHYRGTGGDGGIAIYLNAPDVTNISITNTSIIEGGNGMGDTGYRRAGGSGADAIFVGGGDSLTNINVLNSGGSILGGNGGDSGRYENAGSGADAIVFNTDGDINGGSLVNTGLVAGGNGGNASDDNSYEGGNGGDALFLYSDAGNISGFTLLNGGNLFGGAGGMGGDDENGGSGGDAVHIDANDANINGLTLTNAGNIIGGAGGNDTRDFGSGGGGGYGIYVNADSDITNFALTNTGNISGGRGADSGFEEYGASGGDAIFVDSSNLYNFKLMNTGSIVGGKGGAVGDNAFAGSYYGGYGGDGINIDTGDFNNSIISNSGYVAGGESGNTGTNGYWPGEGGIGIYLDVSTITSGTVVNTGTVRGGNGTDVDSATEYGGYGGVGIEIDPNSIDGFTLINTGLVAGGNGGNGGYYEADGGDAIDIYGNPVNNLFVSNSGAVVGGQGSTTGGYGGDALYIDPPSGHLTNVYVLNTGYMAGGDGHGSGWIGGEAIDMLGYNTTNVVIDNHGILKGGNSDSDTNSGTAVKLSTNGVTLNNYGTIAAGTGLNPTAIVLNGNNNTVNLYGHSVTSGMIVSTPNSGQNNYLNIKLSGISPAVALNIQAQLNTQGIQPGQASSGSITVRGLTIQWDPIVVNIQTSSYQLQAATPNQSAIGASLDSAIVNPTGDLLTLFNAIDQSGNVPGALAQLSPQEFQIFGDIALAGANFDSLQIDQRLNNLRDGSESIDTSGLGGETTAGFDKDGKDGKGVIQTVSEGKKWGFFASGDALHATVDGDANTTAAKFTTAGLVLGLDGKLNEHWVIGTLFSYQHTAVDLDTNGSQANIDSIGGGLYAGYHNGGYYGNGLLTYTRNNYDTFRMIAIPGFNRQANGSTNSNQFAINVDGGYDFNLTPLWTVGPIAGLQYVHLGVDGFTESGAGAANLAIGDQDVDSLRSRLGFRIAYHKQIGKEVSFGAEARAEWQHEFLDDSRGISAGFAGSGLAQFSVATKQPERDAALLGVGLNITVRNRMTIFADYDVQAGQSSYFEQSIRGGLKFAW